MSQYAADIILEARAITRRYPGITALNAVDFRVHRNQVNVLIGENGAGKSTLMRLLAGIETPDEGGLFSRWSAHSTADRRERRQSMASPSFTRNSPSCQIWIWLKTSSPDVRL